MKTSRFFNTFLPAIVQRSALKLTRMISLLFYPQQRGFIPPCKGKLVQPGQKALLQVFVMSFTAYFYLKDNLCRIAPQSISFGWGRISSIDQTPSLSAQSAGGWRPFVKFRRFRRSTKSRNLIF